MTLSCRCQRYRQVLRLSMSSLVAAVSLIGFLSATLQAASIDQSSPERHKVRSRHHRLEQPLHQSPPARYVSGPGYYLQVSSEHDAGTAMLGAGRANSASAATNSKATSDSSMRSHRAVGHVRDGANVGERCEAAVRDVHNSLLRLHGSQVEYGRGLHTVHDMVETLRRDVDHLSSSKSNGLDFRSTNERLHSSSISKNDAGPDMMSLTQLTSSVRNITSGFRRQTQQQSIVERRLKHLQTVVDDVRVSIGRALSVVSDSSMASKQCNEAVEHIGSKQTEINANLMRKITSLENMLTELRTVSSSSSAHRSKDVQSDSPLSAANRWQHSSYMQRIATGLSCPPGYVHYASSCYKFENRTLNWIDAEKHCQSGHQDSHLVAIETKAEMDALIAYRSHNNARWSSRYIWIGANDMASEGHWTWVGTGLDLRDVGGFTDWRPGQPDNHNGDQHCVYARVDSSAAGLAVTSPCPSVGPSKTNDGAATRTQQYKGSSPLSTSTVRQDTSVRQVRAGTWDDWHCYSARLNFVCEIVLQP